MVIKKNIKYDNRMLLLLLILIYSSNILISYLYFGDYSYILKNYLAIPVIPVFRDTEVILRSFDIYRAENYNMFSAFDYSHLGYSYPRIIYLFSYLGLSERHTMIVSIILIITFFITIFLFIGKISLKESLVYALIICSPPFMLVVERCNIEVLVFILLYVILLLNLKKPILRYLSYALLIFISTLKIYPFFTTIYYVKEKRNKFLLVILSVSAFFSLYLFLIKDDINALSQMLSNIYGHSFGATVSFEQIKTILPEYIPKIQLSYDSKTLGLVTSMFFILGLYIISINKRFKILYSENIDSYRIGSIIFVGSFLMGNNFYYRLIFLLFTIPLLIEWYKSNIQYKKYIGFILFCLIFVFVYEYFKQYNKLLFSDYPHTFFSLPFFLFNEFSYWILFGFYVFSLMVTLPDDIKKMFFIK